MNFERSSEVIYRYAAERLKLRKEHLGLTNDIISGKKIYVHFKEYIDWADDSENEPERFDIVENPRKSSFDSTMISRIINNNKKAVEGRNSPNPYLIPPIYEDLLLDKLQFENRTELFWGNIDEQEYIIKSFYSILFDEILEVKQLELNKILRLLIEDYVPYSSNSAYYKLIVDRCHEYLQLISDELMIDGMKMSAEQFWDIFHELYNSQIEDLVKEMESENPVMTGLYTLIKIILEMIGKVKEDADCLNVLTSFAVLECNNKYFKKEALGRILYRDFDRLSQLYKDYFLKLNNFKFLQKKIEMFVTTELTTFFRDVTDDIATLTTTSHGFRVKSIIEADITNIFDNIIKIAQGQGNDNQKSHSSIYERVLKSALIYIEDLKLMQWITDKELAPTTNYEDMEKLFIFSIEYERLHEEWERNYKVSLNEIKFEKYKDVLESEEYEDTQYIENYGEYYKN